MSKPQSRWDLGPWWHHGVTIYLQHLPPNFSTLWKLRPYSVKPLRSNFLLLQPNAITNIYTGQVLLAMRDAISFFCHTRTLIKQPGLWFSFCTMLDFWRQQMRIIDDDKCSSLTSLKFLLLWLLHHNFRNSIEIPRVVSGQNCSLCAFALFVSCSMAMTHRVCILTYRCMWDSRNRVSQNRCLCSLMMGMQNSFSSRVVYLHGVTDSHHLETNGSKL